MDKPRAAPLRSRYAIASASGSCGQRRWILDVRAIHGIPETRQITVIATRSGQAPPPRGSVENRIANAATGSVRR